MAKLTAKKRNALPKSSFVFPDSRAFPINDAPHARKALQLGGRKSAATQKKIRSAVKRKYPSIGKKK